MTEKFEALSGGHRLPKPNDTSVGNNIILQYIALFGAYYISAILRIAISY
jgi:hypothetical protein